MSQQGYCFKDIESAVCNYFEIEPAQLRGRSNARVPARRRFIAVYLARELTGMSLPVLGEKLHKDHTTILLAERRARELANTDADFFDQLAGVKEILFSQRPYMERVRQAQSDFGGMSKPKKPKPVAASIAATWA
jgi:hypothetical protein